ncbi:Hypothetical predicted protein [Lynx pardinus]|uniref:Uncharacterized protein n=1 Tax=Lynx pardinus TaxID=191816 RepID=A0A485NGE8_LYNPA|nr:Hypothetical predicted protein [Lynx pardinus]
MRGSGDNGVLRLPSLWPGNFSLRSAVAHPSSVFSFRPLPASSLSVTEPQAAPLSRVLSQMRLFSPPLTSEELRLDPLRPSAGRSQRATAECRPHPGTPVDPRDCGRCQPAPEKVRQAVYQWHLGDDGKSQRTPGTRLPPQRPCSGTSECGRFAGSAGTRWPQQSLPNALPAVAPLFSVRPFPPEHRQVGSCRVAAFALPLSLHGI